MCKITPDGFSWKWCEFAVDTTSSETTIEEKIFLLWSALIFSRVTSQDFYFVTISISKRWVKLVLLKKDLCDRHLSSWSAKVTRVRILPTKFCFSFDSYTFYLANTKGNVELVVRSTLVGEVRRVPKSLRGDCEQFSSLVLWISG